MNNQGTEKHHIEHYKIANSPSFLPKEEQFCIHHAQRAIWVDGCVTEEVKR